MGTRDDRIDAYIARSADFARPILEHLREVVHQACPQVRETMKWSFPHFEHHGILCSMASFRQHCAFGLWKASLILEHGGQKAEQAMGHFGRITSVDDLPPRDVLIDYIQQGMRLNEAGTKAPAGRQPRAERPEIAVPDDLAAALRADPAARAAFDGFSPSNRREYLEWITEAKADATRQKRLRQAVEWMAEGKPRNWKYVRT